MAEKKHAVLWNIIQEHLYLDVYEGIARNKQQIVATAGGMVGEANRQANRAKVFYGKFMFEICFYNLRVNCSNIFPNNIVFANFETVNFSFVF